MPLVACDRRQSGRGAHHPDRSGTAEYEQLNRQEQKKGEPLSFRRLRVSDVELAYFVDYARFFSIRLKLS
jgi:hypothetical protein